LIPRFQTNTAAFGSSLQVNSGISACERAERWSHAVHLLDFMVVSWHSAVFFLGQTLLGILPTVKLYHGKTQQSTMDDQLEQIRVDWLKGTGQETAVYLQENHR
jgi:hypothetical protein